VMARTFSCGWSLRTNFAELRFSRKFIINSEDLLRVQRFALLVRGGGVHGTF
jgi:hypothetical protein